MTTHRTRRVGTGRVHQVVATRSDVEDDESSAVGVIRQREVLVRKKVFARVRAGHPSPREVPFRDWREALVRASGIEVSPQMDAVDAEEKRSEILRKRMGGRLGFEVVATAVVGAASAPGVASCDRGLQLVQCIVSTAAGTANERKRESGVRGAIVRIARLYTKLASWCALHVAHSVRRDEATPGRAGGAVRERGIQLDSVAARGQHRAPSRNPRMDAGGRGAPLRDVDAALPARRAWERERHPNHPRASRSRLRGRRRAALPSTRPGACAVTVSSTRVLTSRRSSRAEDATAGDCQCRAPGARALARFEDVRDGPRLAARAFLAAILSFRSASLRARLNSNR